MSHKLSAIICAIAIIATAPSALAIPQLINYQAVLTDGGGNPITTSTVVEFRIWDMSAGGTMLWTEFQNIVPNGDGVFSVVLGTITPIPDSVFDGDAYLGLTVSPDPEMTRQQIVSAGYAYRVGSVEGATGGNILTNVSIGSGHTNTGTDAFVAGAFNSVTGLRATIPGGQFSSASGNFATVGGGAGNTSSGIGTTVGGGSNNLASGTNATVGGGTASIASGDYSCVPGGYGNAARGERSLALGTLAKANHDGSIVLSARPSTMDSDSGYSTIESQIVLNAENGVYFTRRFCDSMPTCSVWDTAAGGAAYIIVVAEGARCNGPMWLNYSSRAGKENFTEIDGTELLEKVAALPVTRWNYKRDGLDVQHIGPTAEDFFAAFGVGNDDRSISTIDPAGIALAAIQELVKRNQDLESDLSELRRRVEMLSGDGQ